MLRNHLLSAVRNIRNNRLYTVINVFGLAIGLTCAMLILLFVKDELSFDRFHANADRIYRIDRHIVRPDGSSDMAGFTGYVQGPRFAAKVPGIRSFVRFLQGRAEFKSGEAVESLPVSVADANFFSVFSFPLKEGDPRTVLSAPNSIVLTETSAKTFFGNAEALGKTLLMKRGEKFVPMTVSGIAKDCPANSSIRFQLLIPMNTSGDANFSPDAWFNFEVNTFVELEPGAQPDNVDAGMQRIFLSEAAEAIRMIKEKYGVKDIGISYFLQPVTDIHLSKKLKQNTDLSEVGSQSADYILSGIAVFVLLVACINFVNLNVARSVKRAKEIGVRKVIGGSRPQLILQFFGEASLLCLLAFVMAIGLVQLVLPFFNSIANKNLSFAYLLDAKLIACYVILYFATSLLAGFYPALVLSRFDPVKTLYGRFSMGNRNYLQKSLVVLQFTLASLLVIGTVTVFYQFRYLTSQPVGYDDNNLISVSKSGISPAEFQLFRKDLMKNPDIIAVQIYSNSLNGNTVRVNRDQNINIIQNNIDTGFLSVMKIPLVAGRNFSAEFKTDSDRSVLVNESFVKAAGWSNPVGQSLTFIGEAPVTVVGVVRDHHFQPLTEKIQPELFSMKQANGYGGFLIRIRPHAETSALASIGRSFGQLFPMNSYSYSFKTDDNAAGYETEARWKRILFFGAIVTIFLSCIGLFGLTVLSAERRVKEIGIRKVLGASAGNVVSILTADFLKLVVLALIISFPIAGLFASKWLQNYPYRISITWGLFASVAVGMTAIAGLTITFQALKAAMANPARSLRTD